MQNYRIMLLIAPTLSEEEFSAKVAEVGDLIKKAGGQVSKEDIWGLRDLAYKIGPHFKGYYALLEFSQDGAKMGGLESILKIDESVLRWLVTKE